MAQLYPTQLSSDCSAVIMIISSPEMWITMFPAAKNVQLKMGCRRQPAPPPPPAAQLKSFLNLIWSKKKRKLFGRSNHYRKSILQQYFFLYFKAFTQKLQNMYVVKPRIYVSQIFSFCYQKFVHFKNFWTFQIAAVYFKNLSSRNPKICSKAKKYSLSEPVEGVKN